MARGKPKKEKKRLAPNLTWRPEVAWMSHVSPAGLCICCGELVVWVKCLEGAVPIRWFSWDGNPSFNPRKHKVHSEERYQAYLESIPKKDPMFCLDDEDLSGEVASVSSLGDDDKAFVPYSDDHFSRNGQ